MNEDIGTQLGRRERQIVEVLYRLGKASVAEVLAELPDPPSYSAVRGMLTLLEEKGHVRHKRDGMRYVYTPAIAPAKSAFRERRNSWAGQAIQPRPPLRLPFQADREPPRSGAPCGRVEFRCLHSSNASLACYPTSNC